MTEIQPKTPNPKSPIQKLIAGLVLIVLIAGIAPIFALASGVGFLPSAAWVVMMTPIALGTSAVVGVLIVSLIHIGRADNPVVRDMGPVILTGLYLFVALLFGWMAYFAVLITFPMAHVLSIREETRQAYLVKDPVGPGGRDCRQSVSLIDMPFMYDSLCGTPIAMQNALQPDQTVYALGIGSSLGVFYDRFEW